MTDVNKTKAVFDFIERIAVNETLDEEIRLEAYRHLNAWDGTRINAVEIILAELDTIDADTQTD